MKILDNDNINETIKSIDSFFNKEGADKTEALAIKLLTEDILSLFAVRFTTNTKYSVIKKRKRSSVYVQLKIKSSKFDPFNNEDLQEEELLMYGRLIKYLKVLPIYKYKNGVNIIIFKIDLLGSTLKTNLKFCWSFMEGTKSIFILSIVLQVISAVLLVWLPILSASLIVSYADSLLDQIILLAINICIVKLIITFLNLLIVRIHNRVYFSIQKNLAVHVCKKTTMVKNYCLDQKGAGIFVNRLIGDVSSFAHGIHKIASQIILILRYVGIIIAVFSISPPAFVYIMCSLIVGSYIERKRSLNYKKKDRIYRDTMEKYSNFIVELVNGIKDIKLFNGSKNFVNKTEAKIEESREKGLNMMDTNIFYSFLRDNFTIIFDCGFMILLGMALYSNFMGTTSAFALVLYNYNTTLGPNTLVSLSVLIDEIRNFNLSGERIAALIESEDYPKDEFGTLKVEKLKGNIQAKNITFAYNHDDLLQHDINILHNINFTINSGQTVGFVGKTGSGKTTILNLLGKLYDVYDGQLLLDSYNINDLDEETLRANTITVTQNAHIFNMSIKDNLKIVNENITDEEIKKVCQMACIHDYISSLHKGYNTVVGENGITLSGGQRQRLAIARALILKPSLIMFDESTSALDNITQNNVINNIKSYAKDSTIIMVAHRLSTIKDADKLFFIDDGRIIAEGTHNYLLKTCETYRELYYSEDL